VVSGAQNAAHVSGRATTRSTSALFSEGSTSSSAALVAASTSRSITRDRIYAY
jgi:hypothetical protein